MLIFYHPLLHLLQKRKPCKAIYQLLNFFWHFHSILIPQYLLSTTRCTLTFNMPFHSSSGSSYRSVRKCRRRHCDKEVAYYQSSDKSSFYCSKHSCHASYKCRTPSEDGERFCEYHAICGSPGCGKRISDEDKSFRFSKGNTTLWLCSEHRCKADGCYKHRRDSNTKYCEDHAKENKCEASDCSSDRSSKHYCDKHSCQHPHCTQKTLASGRSKGKCRHHQSCASSGCTRHVDLDSTNDPKTFCAYHCQCKMARCHGIVQTGSSFCAEHECSIPSCNRPRDLDRAPGTRFCHRHRCSVIECRSSFVDSKGFNFRRCPRHICELTGCDREARTHGSISPFCSDHRCLNNDCLNPAKIKHGFCRKDACLKPECGQPKADGYQDYCLNHIPTTPSSRSDYSTPALPPSRSTGSPWGFSSSGSRPYVVYCPKPIRISELLGSSSRSRSRELRYMQMNNAFRDSTPRHQRH